jgi:hypothetical protein
MKNKGHLIPLLLILACLSCEKDANNVKLPRFDHKLVITSFISPYDSVSYVTVDSNERLYGDLTDIEPLGNLKVTISDGTKKTELKKGNIQFFIRRKDMPIRAGVTYNLEVTSDNGLRADAKCPIPFQRDLNISADTSKIHHNDPQSGSWSELIIKVFLEDPPGEKNYYCVEGRMLDYNRFYGGYPYITNLFNEDERWFNDEGFDGKRIFSNSFSSQYNPSNSDSVKAVIYILNTNRDYFTYLKSLAKYSGGGNPFSEVSPVYSNINEGLGIFAGYTVDSMVLRLK